MTVRKQITRCKLSYLSLIGLIAGLTMISAPVSADVELDTGVVPHQQIDALYDKLSVAVASLDSQPFSEIYAQKGYYLVPKSPMIHGLDGIRADWDKWFSWMKEGNGSLEINFRIIARELYDDKVGYDVGYAKTLQKRPGEPDQVFESKIFLVTKKQENGEWRFEVDSYSFLK